MSGSQPIFSCKMYLNGVNESIWSGLRSDSKRKRMRRDARQSVKTFDSLLSIEVKVREVMFPTEEFLRKFFAPTLLVINDNELQLSRWKMWFAVVSSFMFCQFLPSLTSIEKICGRNKVFGSVRYTTNYCHYVTLNTTLNIVTKVIINKINSIISFSHEKQCFRTGNLAQMQPLL